MKKKQILLGILIAVIGFVAGCLVVIAFLGQSYERLGDVSGLHYRTDWERRAFQAYSQESPQVGIWALSNLADVLQKQEKVAEKNEKKLIEKDLIFTYTRLAIAFRKAKDDKKYQENISKALDLAKIVYSDTHITEKDILSIVEKIDQGVRKKKINNP
jgi:hypothetical protein